MEYEGIDLRRIVNIYPSVVVQHGQERTTISFEWFDENSQSVQKIGYALIFILDDGSKKELFYDNYETLHAAMRQIATLLKK